MNLFSYADAQKADAEISGSLAAADAMATRAPQLSNWVEATDVDARKLDLSLGIFTDPAKSDSIEESFAMLGGVEEQPVTFEGQPAMRLVLRQLKPAVERSDVVAMADKLGLTDLVLLDSRAN
jgi:rare lipoprotein A